MPHDVATTSRLPLAWSGGVVLLALVSALGLARGSASLPVVQVLQALQGQGDTSTIAIVQSLRAPRVVLAMLVGAGLAMSGGTLQGTLRNPLAEPYLLGVSGGAAVGAVLAMMLGWHAPLAITGSAFGGAALATLLTTMLARVAGGSGDTRLLIMAGVIIGAFANAVIMVALADAPAEQVRGALWWMMGSVGDASWPAVGRGAAATLPLAMWLVWRARDLDVIALGAEPAVALGVNVERTAQWLFLVGSWLAAATVASAGLIGFMGLVVPNLARAMGASRHRPMLLLSALYGAVLLVAADLVARTVRAPVELPLGAVTALVGVPFFLMRLRKVSGS
jgi:iron complex transport system permease protein